MANQLRNNILGTALWWIERQCYEQTQNRGRCIDYLHERYAPQWVDKQRNEAYCAKFVSVVLKEAFDKMGAKSPVYSAGARDLLNQAKAKGIRIDRTPSAGAFFYKAPVSPKYTGHVGIVYENIDGNKFKTIEGNATDPVTKKEGVVSMLRSISSDPTLRIAHVEDFLDFNPTLYAGSDATKYLLIAVLGGLVYTNREQIFG